jgi:glycosyltransferase involved in cell wall biosynthesis
MRLILTACGPAHLRPIAKALDDREALAGLWIPDKNTSGIPRERFRRCWPYHLAMKPFYHLAPLGLKEKIALALFPIWASWVRHQTPPPFDAVFGILGHATPIFDVAERSGALKILDATNSHPTSFYGFWQRECDLWCPGAKPGLPRSLFARANREIERADVILCPSTYVLESMLYNGIPESKCVLNPYGVDTSIFTQRSVVPHKPRFICVGQIGLRKGQQYLFRAFQIVRQKLPDAELICVGGYYPDFRLERRRWENTFTHYEGIPTGDLAKLLRESTAFVLPSNEEGFAKAVIEGMAAGLPIIATHQSGATTLVRDGVEGFIVRGRDIKQLADTMIKVATDRVMNEQMGRAAHASGARSNTWGEFADRLITMCREARAKR